MIDDNAPSASSENSLLCHPEKPQRRYRPGPARWNGDPLRESSAPIAWASDAWIASLGTSYNSQNIDFGGVEVWNPGNARFRHNGLGCNVAFVDGSVQTFFLNPRKVISGSGAQTFVHSDFKRSYLQTKHPGMGIKDSGVD
jgi:prepilin-type processing-associated H-X9-DG protein